MLLYSLVNAVLADSGYNALSADTKIKFERYLSGLYGNVQTNTLCETRNNQQNYFESKNNYGVQETNNLELQKEMMTINDQFKNVLKEKNDLKLHIDTLSKNLFEAEDRERMTKMNEEVLLLKIDSLTENILKYTNKLSSLQSKYYKEINELKANIDNKDAEVLMLNNDINVLKIKSENKKNKISLLKHELENINLEHTKEIEQIQNEFTSNRKLYENEVLQNKELTKDIVNNKDYVCGLTDSLNDIEKKYSTLVIEYEKYKLDNDNIIFSLKNRLDAAEEIVKQLHSVEDYASSNHVIKKGTTITDVYAIYKETSLKLQTRTEELEHSKNNLKLLKQQLVVAAPNFKKLEKDLIESKDKEKELNSLVSRLKRKLIDVEDELKCSNIKCDQLLKDNNDLHNIEDQLNLQICFLLRDKQSDNTQNRNLYNKIDANSIKSKKYYTFADIQDLQNQNKNLLKILHSSCNIIESNEILNKDLKENIQTQEKKLDTELIKEEKIDDTEDKEDGSNESKNYITNLTQQLTTANITINHLKIELEANKATSLQLDKHIEILNNQINELLGKIKISNIKHSENEANITTLQETILTLESENDMLNIEMDKIKKNDNLKKDDSMELININYSQELKQKTELCKEFENILTNQLDLLIKNWDLTLKYVAESDFNKDKFESEYEKLLKLLMDVRNCLLLKFEVIDDSNIYKEMADHKSNSFSLCSDERNNFLRTFNKLEHGIQNLKESGQSNNELNIELNVIKEYYKSLEEKLNKMSKYSSQLENDFEIKNQEYLEKNEQLMKVMQELSTFKLSQENSNNIFQNQLLENKQINCKLSNELEVAKKDKSDLLTTMTEQNNTLLCLQEKLSQQENKLQMSEDSLNQFYNSKSTEIKYGKNKNIAMDNLTEEIQQMRKQLTEMTSMINILKKEKNAISSKLNDTTAECYRWKSDSYCQSKIVDDMQSQMNELKQLHTSNLDKNNDYSTVLEKLEQYNEIVEQYLILKEENTLFSNQLQELKEQNEQETAKNKNLKDEISDMQSLIDQNTAELKKLESDHLPKINSVKQEVIKYHAVGNIKNLNTLKNKIRNSRQKFENVTAEMDNVKVLARQYKNQCEMLNNTLNAERSSWKTKINKLIELGKQKQITGSESLLWELQLKVVQSDADMNVAKSQLEEVKANSDNNEMRTKILLRQVRNRIKNTLVELDATKKQRDDLLIQLEKIDINDRIKDYRSQIIQSNEENKKLITENKLIRLEKDGLLNKIRELNHKINRLEEKSPNTNKHTVNIKTSPSNGEIDRVRNINDQTMASGFSSTNDTSLDTTLHSNNNNRKRKSSLLMTSYMKRFKPFTPREKNYKEPISSQRYVETQNSHIKEFGKSQYNKQVKLNKMTKARNKKIINTMDSQEYCIEGGTTENTNYIKGISDIKHERTEYHNRESFTVITSDDEVEIIEINYEKEIIEILSSEDEDKDEVILETIAIMSSDDEI